MLQQITYLVQQMSDLLLLFPTDYSSIVIYWLYAATNILPSVIDMWPIFIGSKKLIIRCNR
ncbi:MAG: hypothetical protein Q8798_02570, partial [Candidatus Phytoplasma australasiaticum]|nr:hypothetical protein [Candidatus Phytoplasma australasiaticum]